MKRLVLGTLVLLLGLVLAHHGWSEYDAEKAFKATGVVKKVGFDNPHVVIDLEVAAGGGTPAKTWVAVLAPPTRMIARGLRNTTIQEGMTVTVEGYPHRREANEMRAERIVVDGKTVELR